MNRIGMNQYTSKVVSLHMANGVVCKVTKRWWERFLDGEIKRLTTGVLEEVNFRTRGSGTNVNLEQGQEGRRPNAHTAG